MCDHSASVADDWESINTTMGHYCLAQAEQAAATGSKEPCHLTQEEFVDDVQASFQLAMAVGIVTSIYMLVGLVASLYISFQSGDDLSHSDALVQVRTQEIYQSPTCINMYTATDITSCRNTRRNTSVYWRRQRNERSTVRL